MASISTDKNGNRTIQFKGVDRKRRSIRLGNVPMKAAKSVCELVEALVAARKTGTTHSDDISNKLAAYPELARKLAAVGLTGQRIADTTLDAFIAAYIAGRTDLKPATRIGLEQARKRLMAFFEPSTPLRDFTQADADKWVIYLRGKYAEATAARTLKRACQFFRAAKRARLVSDNPFDDIKPGSMKNAKRLFIVPAEWAERLIEACPDADWRAIVALCRYGGMRCPSEVLALTWNDIDWHKGRLLIRASKTEHHEHQGLRWIPLFPELRPHLDALWTAAPAGQVHVINRYREQTQNLRTTFLKIILRAGLKPWPRLMQNLRATRETELAARFPLHVVTAWMGNTEAVAARHYLSVRDEDFAEALQVVQIPVQRGTIRGCTELHEGKPSGSQIRTIQPSATPCNQTHSDRMAAVGPEPNSASGLPATDLGNSPDGAGANSGAEKGSSVESLAVAAEALTPAERARLADILARQSAEVESPRPVGAG